MIAMFGRVWTALLPVALLAAVFKYAHKLNSIISSIEGMGSKKTTLTIMLISFLAVWSLLYLSSVFFVRIMRWIWSGTTPAQVEQPSAHVKKELEYPANYGTEYSSLKEQENLFKLDLQDEPIGSPNGGEYKGDKVFK